MASWNRIWGRAQTAVVVAALLPVLLAAKHPANRSLDGAKKAEAVDLFAAIEAGQAEVLFVPNSSERARLSVTNKTARPLSVRLPEGFAALPVLAQFANPIGNVGNQNNNQNNNASRPQTIGVAPNAPMNNGQNNFPLNLPGGRGNNPGGNLWNIGAGKTVRHNVACVCLEHGLAEPRPSMRYDVAPLDQVSTDPAVHALLREFGRGRYSQRAVQAAAWHLANKMSWADLAAKRVEHVDGSAEAYFTTSDLEQAQQVTKQAQQAAQQKPPESPASPGQDLSVVR